MCHSDTIILLHGVSRFLVPICVCMYVCMHVCVYMYVCMFTSYMSMYICIYTYENMSIYMSTRQVC